MATSEQFSLRWNDFHTNLAQSIQSFLEDEDLVDVTLAVGGQLLYAHKLILSLCSPYFKELFKTHQCDHPVVFLKDVTPQEIKQLLQFMYRGVVNVRQQELYGLLQTAEMLQIKGLTGGRDSASPPPTEVMKPRMQESSGESQSESVPGAEDSTAAAARPLLTDDSPRRPLKRLLKRTPNMKRPNIRNNPLGGFGGHSDNKNFDGQRTDAFLHPENSENKYDSPRSNDNLTAPENSENTFDGPSVDGLTIPENTYDNEPLNDSDNDSFHSDMVFAPEKETWKCKPTGVKCPSCHRLFANRYNLKVHIRDKHDTAEGTLQCDICKKRMRNPSCLRVHLYHHRKQAAYLAQLSIQGDQMRHVVNMVGKWRKDTPFSGGDHGDVKLPATSLTPEVNNVPASNNSVPKTEPETEEE